MWRVVSPFVVVQQKKTDVRFPSKIIVSIDWTCVSLRLFFCHNDRILESVFFNKMVMLSPIACCQNKVGWDTILASNPIPKRLGICPKLNVWMVSTILKPSVKI